MKAKMDRKLNKGKEARYEKEKRNQKEKYKGGRETKEGNKDGRRRDETI